MSSKRPPTSLAGRPSKLCKPQLHHCPNGLCNRSFPSSRSLKIHISKTPSCVHAVMGLPHTHLFLPDSESVAVNDDTDSSIDDCDEPWSCLVPWDTSNDESKVSFTADDVSQITAKQKDDLPLGDDIPCQSVSQDVLRYGISFTASEFVETKLLKMLNDAHAPHFLYQDILNWAKEAKLLQYDFCPRRSTCKAQIKHIEK